MALLLTPEGMEELRQLGGACLRSELGGSGKKRVREILGDLDEAMWDLPWDQVERTMFFVLGIYSIGRLGYEAAMRQAHKAMVEGEVSEA